MLLYLGEGLEGLASQQRIKYLDPFVMVCEPGVLCLDNGLKRLHLIF